MNQEINSWLNSDRDFNTGVQLYARFGHSQNLKRILERSEDCPEHVDTLLYELSQLKDEPVQDPVKASTRQIPRKTAAIVNQPVIPAGVHSEDDAVLFEKIKEKLKYRDILHASLSDKEKTDEQRLEIALLILDISDKITEEYERHDHFKKHGVLPPAIEPAEEKEPVQVVEKMTPVQLINWKNNVRTKISYYKKQCNNPDLASKLKHNKSMLDQWETILAEILKNSA
ncbi:MAG: hypothetical protein ACOYNC_19005 [Bacteroidales bacterium]